MPMRQECRPTQMFAIILVEIRCDELFTYGDICISQLRVLQLRGRSCLHIKSCNLTVINNLFLNVFHIALLLNE